MAHDNDPRTIQEAKLQNNWAKDIVKSIKGLADRCSDSPVKKAMLLSAAGIVAAAFDLV